MFPPFFSIPLLHPSPSPSLLFTSAPPLHLPSTLFTCMGWFFDTPPSAFHVCYLFATWFLPARLLFAPMG